MRFADVLRELRAEAGLTQEELAEAAKLSPRTISDLERGINRTAHKDTAGLLADALGLAGPVRGVFVAAARGRVSAAKVLAARLDASADPAVDPQAAAVTPAGVPAHAGAKIGLLRPVPAQLPHRIPGFTGRDAELGRLDALATRDGGESAKAVVITAIAGTAGVGKTALAVYWAHRIREEFPDGQLYVNLRGFDPTGIPMEPDEAIRGFLDAFAVAPGHIPTSLDLQAALYRSMLANRRVLIVLDNARDAEQVRPLLPGSPGCLAVVTSRNLLTGLIATDGAHPVSVGLLSVDEARKLLAYRLGASRVAAEPEAVDKIIAACARLPLPLSIAAARAATKPGVSLAALAGELQEAQRRLDAFDGGDQSTDVRAVFSWSYQRLGAPAARLFRMLGLHPGPDLSMHAAASLAGVSLTRVRSSLAELSRTHLIMETIPGRFTLHDLLRAYAAELAETTEPEDERRAARHRLLDHYLHTAHRADQMLNPHRDDPITLQAAGSGVTPEWPSDHQQGLTWFAAEYQVLLAAIRQAVGNGFDTHAWQLGWTLTAFFQRSGLWHDAVVAQMMALQAARRAADRRGQAVAHGCLAYAYIRLDRYSEAQHHVLQALELYEGLGDLVGEAHAHRTLTWLFDRQGRYREALPHAEQALELFGAAGHRTGEARALNAVGWFHAQLGDHSNGLIYCQRALELQREIGDQFGQADTLDSLGEVHRGLLLHHEAIACYQEAIDLYQDFGDRYNEAETLISLGESCRAVGDSDSTRTAWERALTILDQLGHREADRVRGLLKDLPSSAGYSGNGRRGHARSAQP
jgi:tetratricopeptide (TPR) repeat protein/transcriptional regulator with XRE-family HTH domain